jgi:short-subunit dehydrogenase
MNDINNTKSSLGLKSKNTIALGLGLAIGGWLAWQRVSANRVRYPGPELNDRPGTALITGASSGIGATFARRLAAQGYDLVLVARREERLTALATELHRRHGVQAEVLVADLADPAAVARVEQVIEGLDTLSLLINNAGFGASTHFIEVDLATHVDMIQVNVTAVVRLSRAALPGLVARGRGTIINVSSLAAFVSTAGNVTYGATKSYLNAFSEALQAELRGTGVHIQALCPGFTRTEFHYTPELKHFDPNRLPKPLWMSAEAVVEESLAALGRGQVIVIPGRLNRLGVMTMTTPLGRPLLAILKWML